MTDYYIDWNFIYYNKKKTRKRKKNYKGFTTILDSYVEQ